MGDEVGALNTLRKTHEEYIAAVEDVAWVTAIGGPGSTLNAASGIASVSPLLRLPYWHHKAMVAMGICHLLFYNTTKKFLNMVGLNKHFEEALANTCKTITNTKRNTMLTYLLDVL